MEQQLARIEKKIDPHAMGWGPYDFNLFDLSEEEKEKIEGLPENLGQASRISGVPPADVGVLLVYLKRGSNHA